MPAAVKGSNPRPPTFIGKTYAIISDPATDHLLCWDHDGETFTVRNPERLAQDVFPHVFSHASYPSFTRALNAYGFRQVARNKWKHADFRRGSVGMLDAIQRKRPPGKRAGPARVGAARPSSSDAMEAVEPVQLELLGYSASGCLQVIESQRLTLGELQADVSALQHELRAARSEELQLQAAVTSVLSVLVREYGRQTVESALGGPLEQFVQYAQAQGVQRAASDRLLERRAQQPRITYSGDSGAQSGGQSGGQSGAQSGDITYSGAQSGAASLTEAEAQAQAQVLAWLQPGGPGGGSGGSGGSDAGSPRELSAALPWGRSLVASPGAAAGAGSAGLGWGLPSPPSAFAAAGPGGQQPQQTQQQTQQQQAQAAGLAAPVVSELVALLQSLGVEPSPGPGPGRPHAPPQPQPGPGHSAGRGGGPGGPPPPSLEAGSGEGAAAAAAAGGGRFEEILPEQPQPEPQTQTQQQQQQQHQQTQQQQPRPAAAPPRPPAPAAASPPGSRRTQAAPAHGSARWPSAPLELAQLQLGALASSADGGSPQASQLVDWLLAALAGPGGDSRGGSGAAGGGPPALSRLSSAALFEELCGPALLPPSPPQPQPALLPPAQLQAMDVGPGPGPAPAASPTSSDSPGPSPVASRAEGGSCGRAQAHGGWLLHPLPAHDDARDGYAAVSFDSHMGDVLGNADDSNCLAALSLEDLELAR